MVRGSLRVDREILFDEVVNALKGMPEDLEEIFILTHYEGKSPREIAASLHLPVSEWATKVRLADRAFFSNLRNKRRREIPAS